MFVSSARQRKYTFCLLLSNRIEAVKLILSSVGSFLALWWSECSAVHVPVLYTHSCSLHSHLSFLPLSNACFYTHMHTLFPPTSTNSLKVSLFTHSYNSSLFSSSSLSATLPLGTVSWNGPKELALRTWSVLFSRKCMWVGWVVESPQSPSESIWGADESGQPSVYQLLPASHLG